MTSQCGSERDTACNFVIHEKAATKLCYVNMRGCKRRRPPETNHTDFLGRNTCAMHEPQTTSLDRFLDKARRGVFGTAFTINKDLPVLKRMAVLAMIIDFLQMLAFPCVCKPPLCWRQNKMAFRLFECPELSVHSRRHLSTERNRLGFPGFLPTLSPDRLPPCSLKRACKQRIAPHFTALLFSCIHQRYEHRSK